MDFNSCFKVPEIAIGMADLMLDDLEKETIQFIKNENYSFEALSKILETNFNVNGDEAIKSMYYRGVLNKVNGGYELAEFSDRLSYFCQYEREKWLSVDEEIRKKIDDWFVDKYALSAKERLEEIDNGKRELIENAYFFTLDETINLIDGLEKDIYLVPCNCRAIADNCEKPLGTCLLFETGDNTDWDRGHGKVMTKEEAKAVVIEADKKGLMHTSETDHAICNCCGDCCYPIRASERIGTTGLWPMRRYDIIWNRNRCINCGKCVRACNFSAFTITDGKVEFHAERCIGCTICASNCPIDAITLKPLLN